MSNCDRYLSRRELEDLSDGTYEDALKALFCKLTGVGLDEVTFDSIRHAEGCIKSIHDGYYRLEELKAEFGVA